MLRQIRYLLSFLLLISVAGQIAAQEIPKHSVLLRGKILPGFVLEDLKQLNITLGVETRITPKQSLGLDCILLWLWDEKDLWDTVTHEELTYGFSQRDFRTVLHFDYRYYFDPQFAQDHHFSLYLSLFNKAGKARVRTEDGYVYERGEQMKSQRHFYDAGLALGIRSGTTELKKFGVDFNLGACKRFEMLESRDIYIDRNTIVSLHNIRSNRWMPWCRLNLYFYLN